MTDPGPRRVGWLAIAVGTVLLVGAGPLSRKALGPTDSGRLGLQLAGIRDLAIGVAMARSRGGDGLASATWARVAVAIQVGDLAVFLLQWRRRRIGWMPVAGTAAGAAATWRLLRG
jgi:hypothetical protein